MGTAAIPEIGLEAFIGKAVGAIISPPLMMIGE